MSIFLIRHGQTNGNRDRIVQVPETPLSDLGQQQAIQLAASFKHIAIDAIICSDHLRTQQTAYPLKNAGQPTFSLQPLLRERDFGDLRGRAYDDIGADIFEDGYSPPNGESQQQFLERVSLAWECILDTYQQSQGNLVVMTHGLVLRELIRQHLKVDNSTLPLSDFQNTCITEVCGKDKKTVLRFCDANHLVQTNIVGSAV